jgi:uncharacterized protein
MRDVHSPENRLGKEKSPYLLQHRFNPVEWWPWRTDALAEAKRLRKPILLSIGYAACHWCHVMAHESFEDPAVAAVMNDLFVNIKVDREERPDIDQIYMAALHLLGEQGGWPLTMFLTPDGEPFWGGTYFPKTARYGRPGFVDVLREVARIFRNEPARIEQNRQALMERLTERTRPPGRIVVGRREVDTLAGHIAAAFDPVRGGLKGAPKFPQASIFELVWRAGLRSGETRYFDLIETTLERICNGGIYDHLGGGFARYSVDDRWLVPHFEKMLYDNAQLLELLALAFARSHRALFRDRARETVEWLAREMLTAEGAFSASLDADSEGEEGKFYVWLLEEIERVLGSDALFFARHYGVTGEGNFEGHNILNRLEAIPTSPEEERRLAALRAKLLAVRSKRVRPGLDDKILADWNGLMIAALVNAGVLLDEPSWIGTAERAFAAIVRLMQRDDRLGHSWREGQLIFPGLASDLAFMIRAGLALHEATRQPVYLDRALAWQRALDRRYGGDAGYFLTAEDAEGLVIRPHAIHDDAIPNPNAVTAQNLIRLAVLAGDDRWREAADRLFDALLPQAAGNLVAHAALLNALDLRLRTAEIVVSGAAADDLYRAALELPFVDRVVVHAASAAGLYPGHPARDKITTGRALFVCVGERCSLPIAEAADLPDTVRSMRAG